MANKIKIKMKKLWLVHARSKNIKLKLKKNLLFWYDADE